MPLLQAPEGLICGVDEAGRGPLAGPVVAAAVILDSAHPIKGLNDSKQLSARRREALAIEIRAKSLAWAIAEASVEEIERINILQASLLAESNRVVLPYDPRARIPGWSRIDLSARWRQDWAGTALTWRLGLDNATNRRAWKESPYQFGHVYLYPQPARNWRLSVQSAF